MSLSSKIKSDCIGIIGTCKNAGKTTVLNTLIREAKNDKKILGITSIGVDGEDIDVVTHTKKPSVYVWEGTLIATAHDLLPYCDITLEVVGVSGISTPLGEVVTIRAKSDGFVQLAGPSTVSGLSTVCADMRSYQQKADRVFIDGALGRKALGVPSLCNELILCSGASLHESMQRVIMDTVFLVELLTLPTEKKCINSTHQYKLTTESFSGDFFSANSISELSEFFDKSLKTLYISGAFTDSIARQLILMKASNYAVSVKNIGAVMLSRTIYEKLKLKNIRLVPETSCVLSAVCVNPFSARSNNFDSEAFLLEMEKAIEPYSIPVIDVNRSI